MGSIRGRRARLSMSGALVLATGAVAALNVLPSQAAGAADAKVNYWRGINPVTELTSDSFREPPSTDRPWVRWNWPPAAVTIPQLEGELEQMAAAGIRGVEIGQGGNPTNEQLTAILTKANALGITVGIKYSGGAPITGTWENTRDYTRTTLNNSRTIVGAGETFNGPVPGTGTIVAVLAYRCTASPCPATGVREIDRSSQLNLTSQLTGTNTDGFFDGTTAGNLNWTAPASPAGAQWVVVTFRAAASQNAPELLSKEGTDALIAGYEAMWTPELKTLLQQNRSDLFVDSHVTDPWGTATELWSSNIAADFQARAGYALVPELAALFYADFAYSDKTDERIRTDFYQVRNDLFIENRVRRFQDWARTRGLALRLQNEDPVVGGAEPPYQDQIDVAYNQHRPEFESLSGADQIDIYRPFALREPLERQSVVLDRVLRRQRRELPRDVAGRPGADEQGVRRRHHQARLPHLSHRLRVDEHVPGLLELRADQLLRLMGPAQPELDRGRSRRQHVDGAQPAGADAGPRGHGRGGLPALVRVPEPHQRQHRRQLLRQQAVGRHGPGTRGLHVGLREPDDARLPGGEDARRATRPRRALLRRADRELFDQHAVASGQDRDADRRRAAHPRAVQGRAEGRHRRRRSRPGRGQAGQ